MSTVTETTALPTTTREIQLAARPVGRPVPSDFRLAASDLPELQEGQFLVRNLFLSVDPYMRGRMNDVKSYVAPSSSTKQSKAAPSAKSSPPAPMTATSATSSSTPGLA